jgi:hypothetical protein
MSDKPKPGKDKDIRFIRQAMEDANALFDLLGGEIQQECESDWLVALTEAMLITTNQLDLLDQMLASPTTMPGMVLDCNRQLRGLIRTLAQARLPPSRQQAVAKMAYFAGNQLKVLLVVKEIRSLP